MEKYYMTFQSIHPLHECWIEVWAHSDIDARLKVKEWQGSNYGGLYGPEDRFNESSFPGGCIAEVDVPNLGAFLAADPTRARVASLMETKG